MNSPVFQLDFFFLRVGDYDKIVAVEFFGCFDEGIKFAFSGFLGCEVADFADQLNVTPKYLSDTVRKITGHGALYHINRSTAQLVAEDLQHSDL